MKNASKSLLVALSLSLAACGGPGKAKTPAEPVPDPAPQVAVGEPAKPALPNVPATPAEAPSGLTATVTTRNPNAQLTQIGTFVDAVFPGMAAFLTPQTLMLQIEGILGVVGLRGIDMNQPLYVLMLDTQQAVLVGTVASEAELSTSVEGTRVQALLHDGFAAIGSFDALHAAGPYALSNLVKAQLPELPTVDLHLGKIMRGPQAAMVRQQLLAQMSAEEAKAGADIMLNLMSNVETVSLSLDATPQAATLRLMGTGLSGDVKAFSETQRPAAYSMSKRVGTGPWAAFLGGRLDLSPFLPLLVKLGEINADPIATQVAAQLGGLNGEMAVGINVFPERQVVGGMELGDGTGFGQLVDTLLSLAGKSFDIEGMKGKLRMKAIKTRAGSLHEVKFTPTTPELKKTYGKRGVSAYFGVVADTLLVTFGSQSKAQARTLTALSGSLGEKGLQLGMAIETSKSLNESFMVAVDLLGLQGESESGDVEPVVLGAGFTADSVTGRLVLPASVMKKAAEGSF